MESKTIEKFDGSAIRGFILVMLLKLSTEVKAYKKGEITVADTWWNEHLNEENIY